MKTTYLCSETDVQAKLTQMLPKSLPVTKDEAGDAR